MDETAPETEDLGKQLEALRRAIPVTRMVDYGVPLGDALNIHAQTSSDRLTAWDVLCERIAQGHLDAANEADLRGHDLTAQQSRRAASALLQCAQLAFNRDGPRKLVLYERSHAVMAHGANHLRHLEKLVVPTRIGQLHGWLVRPVCCQPKAAVLLLGGLSGWGSVYLDMAQALAARGLLAVLGEGPGQGLTRMRSGLHLSAETLPLFGALLDGAASECGNRVGVWGNSFGGLLAAKVAARDHRVRAVCINGAPFAPTVPSFRTAREQMQAVFGVDEKDLPKALDALTMSVERDRMDAAMLVVEGGRDPMVTVGEQHAFLSFGHPKRSRVVCWHDGEHTIYNHAAARNALIADWFADQLAT